MSVKKSKIVVAGASGFIGQALGRTLGGAFHLIGLSRRARPAQGGYAEFRQADLFALRDAERVLEGADQVIYLVHSMMPSARLVQGHFGDLDLLCADNMARAAASCGVKQIIYVGGLVPEDEDLSEHLASRLEVERTLGSKGVPVTALRAGLVVGGGGSSFQILYRLVRRLPVMLCPSWTRTRMGPVDLRVVVQAIERVAREPDDANRVFDLGDPDAVSYQELLRMTANALGLERRFIRVGLFSPALSRLWVSVTTGAPRALIAPLIESLRHDMIPRKDPICRLEGLNVIPIERMLQDAVKEASEVADEPLAFRSPQSSQAGPPTVRSVQRMLLPEGRDALWAAEEYMRWLPRALPGILSVSQDDAEGMLRFHLSPVRAGPVLLRLQHRRARSDAGRQVFRVIDGLLASRTERGRLEFRQVLDGRTLLAGIHEFVPRLPWWVYRFSQAEVHRLVMHRFAAHLRSQPALSAGPSST